MHSSRCDYAQNPIPEDPECYCPGPGEQPLPCGHQREEEHFYNCAEWIAESPVTGSETDR